jgi:catechol 2,3-dioxygenase-like lactoylglutathione lyase family enzyme
MYSHVVVGSNDLDRSKRFYDATFAAIGGSEGNVDPKGVVLYFHNNGVFIVGKPINGEPSTVSNGATIAFAASSPDQVEAWHAAGVSNGGKAIEDPPGPRERSGMKVYLAYLRDPDDNKICAAHVLEPPKN